MVRQTECYNCGEEFENGQTVFEDADGDLYCSFNCLGKCNTQSAPIVDWISEDSTIDEKDLGLEESE